MNYRIVYSNELYHHGVKGMRWGVRRDSKQNARAQKQNLSSRQGATIRNRRLKKAAMIGATVAVTSLAIYSGYKISKLQKDAKVSLGKKYIKLGDQALQESNWWRSQNMDFASSRYHGQAVDYYNKAKKSNYTRKEIIKEMRDIAKNRR